MKFTADIPLTPVDLINRHAAATGSIGYAMAAGSADYNGHFVRVSFKPHAMSGPLWNAEYTWAGRVVIGRGSLASCLRAAQREFSKGARGTKVVAYVHAEAPETFEAQCAAMVAAGLSLDTSDTRDRADWWTGTHAAVSDAIGWGRYGCFAGMMPHALAYTGTVEDWPAERERWLEANRAKRA
jgi:hypothetical protein